jgi:hypothetical protein
MSRMILERDLWWRKFCLGELGNRHFELLVFLLRITLGKPRLVCSIDSVNTTRFTASCFHRMFAGGVSRVFSCLANYGTHILHKLFSYANLSQLSGYPGTSNKILCWCVAPFWADAHKIRIKNYNRIQSVQSFLDCQSHTYFLIMKPTRCTNFSNIPLE